MELASSSRHLLGCSQDLREGFVQIRDGPVEGGRHRAVVAPGTAHLQVTHAELVRQADDMLGFRGLTGQGHRDEAQDARLVYHEGRVNEHDLPAMHMIAGKDEYRESLALEDVEQDVMDSGDGGGYHQYLPIAIDQQEGQTAKDMKVHLDHPTRLMDDQGGIDHEEDAHDDTCEARSGCHYGQAEANGGGEPSDHEGALPGPVDEGQRHGKNEMDQEEPTQKTISVPPSGVEQRDPGVGSRGYQCVVVSGCIAHTVESFPEAAMDCFGK